MARTMNRRRFFQTKSFRTGTGSFSLVRSLCVPQGTNQVLAVLGLSLSLPVAAQADDWPQWRGPSRDSVWHESGLMASFPAGGLKLAWRAPVGPALSSPIVARGQVFVTDSQLSTPKARYRVLCFDAKTGDSVWTHSYEVD